MSGNDGQMLQDPRNEILPIIRYFGERKKIFNIHFRNIRGRRDDFQETYPDNGDMDMVRVALALKEVEYPYMLMPDHMPSHSDDPGSFRDLRTATVTSKESFRLCLSSPDRETVGLKNRLREL